MADTMEFDALGLPKMTALAQQLSAACEAQPDNPARAHLPPFFTPERAAAVRGAAVAQTGF